MDLKAGGEKDVTPDEETTQGNGTSREGTVN